MTMTIQKIKPKPSWFFEDQFQDVIVAGIDEAGCGPLAGPVVAAAVVIDRASFPIDILEKINDSKKMTVKVRQWVYESVINAPYLDYATGLATADEIDTINIANATKLAMARAFLSLKNKPSVALIDGIRMPQVDAQTVMIKQGDQKCYSIALASIIAKVTRDNIMEKLHEQHPHYGWIKNAGYGTQSHIEAIETWGATPYHRKSFSPIKERLAYA